jgi:hypothetical protein
MILYEGDSKLVIDPVRAAGLYVPPAGELRVRMRHDRVFVLWGEKAFSLSTPVAVQAGMALARAGHTAMLASDWVAFQIDATRLVLLPEAAIQLGGVMLKKADRADDFQRSSRRLHS